MTLDSQLSLMISSRTSISPPRILMQSLNCNRMLSSSIIQTNSLSLLTKQFTGIWWLPTHVLRKPFNFRCKVKELPYIQKLHCIGWSAIASKTDELTSFLGISWNWYGGAVIQLIRRYSQFALDNNHLSPRKMPSSISCLVYFPKWTVIMFPFCWCVCFIVLFPRWIVIEEVRLCRAGSLRKQLQACKAMSETKWHRPTHTRKHC